jgi:hypothetical protein
MPRRDLASNDKQLYEALSAALPVHSQSTYSLTQMPLVTEDTRMCDASTRSISVWTGLVKVKRQKEEGVQMY